LESEENRQSIDWLGNLEPAQESVPVLQPVSAIEAHLEGERQSMN
jgi:hypothetical protein